MYKIIAILSGLMCLIAPVAQAATAPKNLPARASLCALKQHELLLAYYLHANKPKEPSLINAMTLDLKAASDCIRDTAAALSLRGLEPRGQELTAEFGRFGTSLEKNLNTVANGDTVGSDPLTEMVGQNQSLVAQLLKADKELRMAGKTVAVPDTEKARNLALTMRYANVLYVERATYAFGVTLSRQRNGEPTTDMLLNDFAKGIVELAAQPSLTPDLKKKVDGANTKFRFIRKAMQSDFDKKALSFSVNFYIDAIVESLQEVANALEAKGK